MGDGALPTESQTETAKIRADVADFLKLINRQPGPRLYETDVETAREMTSRLHRRAEKATPALALVRNFSVTGADGQSVPARLFDSRADRGPGPVLVYYHGGGFVVGDLDTHSALCADIAIQLDMPVVSVSYRLAPEHPWPAAPDDAEAAARAVAAGQLPEGRRATSLLLAGDSAGGTLAIVTALALRDRPAAVPVALLWAIYPAVSASTRFHSFDLYGDGYLLDREQLAWFFRHYAANVRDWRATPTRISQAGLPPTVVLTAGLDPLLDQGRAYAEQCRRDGVPTAHLEAEGTIHGFLSLRRAMPSGEEDLRRATKVIARTLSDLLQPV